MSGSPYPPQSNGQGVGFSMFYVIIGGAALLTAGIVPIGFAIALRRYRRRRLSAAPDSETPSRRTSAGVGGRPQQEKPKLFDVYVKPGLEVGEARFEDILPMAVRIADIGVGEKPHGASTPSPIILRKDRSPRSQGVDEPEAPEKEDLPITYDVAVLITMPAYHPSRVVDELDEYAIGTLKLLPITSPDDPTSR